MPQYQPNIPTGTVDLQIDYLNVQGNFQTLNTTYGIDHVPFANSTPLVNGFHGDIHFNPVSTTATNMPNNYDQTIQFPQGVPATVAGIGQIFSSQVNDAIGAADTGLYWLSGLGKRVALTRNFVPSHAQNGFTFLPGGIILQWGFKAVAVNAWNAGTVTFATANMPFPTACLCVFKMFTGVAGESTSSGDMYITALSATSFTWNFTTSANANYNGFYWAAIGY